MNYPRQNTAHEVVTAVDANNLYRADRLDWPVSGDESRRAHGYIGQRRAARRVRIWKAPGVRAA